MKITKQCVTLSMLKTKKLDKQMMPSPKIRPRLASSMLVIWKEPKMGSLQPTLTTGHSGMKSAS